MSTWYQTADPDRIDLLRKISVKLYRIIPTTPYCIRKMTFQALFALFHDEQFKKLPTVYAATSTECWDIEGIIQNYTTTIMVRGKITTGNTQTDHVFTVAEL